MNVFNNFAYLFLWKLSFKEKDHVFLDPFYGVYTTLVYQELWIIMVNNSKKINMIRVIPVELYSLVSLWVLGFKTSCLATARDNQLWVRV